jgi:hypothetical protein
MSVMKDGARPNQFYVDLTLPAALTGSITNASLAENRLKFYVKATAIPSMEIGEVQIPFRGGQFKIPGDKTFSDWNVTIINDSDFLIRDVFERWNDMVVGNVDRDSFLEDDPLGVMSNGTVAQLNRNSTTVKSYLMTGAWPKSVSDIGLDMGSSDTIEEFSVTFALQWWESTTTRNNTSGDSFGTTG